MGDRGLMCGEWAERLPAARLTRDNLNGGMMDDDPRSDEYARIVLGKMLATVQETPDGVAITIRQNMVEEALTEIGQCFVCASFDHVGADCEHLADYVKKRGGIKDDSLTMVFKDGKPTGLIERRSPEGDRLMRALGLLDEPEA